MGGKFVYWALKMDYIYYMLGYPVFSQEEYDKAPNKAKYLELFAGIDVKIDNYDDFNQDILNVMIKNLNTINGKNLLCAINMDNIRYYVENFPIHTLIKMAISIKNKELAMHIINNYDTTGQFEQFITEA
jgi:hypothetical protein